ncbi:DNA polymerase III subunit delta' [Candidatus Omnitrophota bacterium]
MSLKDVRGQESALDILKRSERNSRLAHAYLFLGPKGCGKKRAALEFSKFLNCEDKKDDACDKCSSCIKIDKLAHPDLFVVERDEKATQISISQIRRIKERLSLKPFEARYNIALIMDAHYMNDESFNSLLKILEEPGQDTLFILTASNQRSLPETIVSRCQIIKFRPLTKKEVENHLKDELSLDSEEAGILSSVSGGNLEYALRLKSEDMLSFKNSLIDEIVLNNGFYKQDQSLLLGLKREDQKEALNLLLGFYRDLIIYKVTRDDNLIINIDRIQDIAKLSESVSIEKAQKYISIVEKIREAISINVNSKLAIRTLQANLT